MRSILPSKRRGVLRVAARLDVARSLIVGVSAIPGRDIKIALVADARAEADPAAIMIGLRLIEGEQGPLACASAMSGIGRNAEERDVTHPLTKRAAGCDVINIEATVVA